MTHKHDCPSKRKMKAKYEVYETNLINARKNLCLKEGCCNLNLVDVFSKLLRKQNIKSIAPVVKLVEEDGEGIHTIVQRCERILHIYQIK